MAIYPAARVHEVWAMVRDFAADAPDAVAAILTIARAVPAQDYPASVAGDPIVIVSYNHSGDAAAVERDVAPLRAGPEPVSGSFASEPYLEVQTSNDLVMDWGHRSYILGVYADDVRSAALDALVGLATRAPDGASFSITVQRGAIARVPDEATAFTGRQARFDLSADSAWVDPAVDETNRDWVRQAMAIVEPDAVMGGYINEIAETGPDVIRLRRGQGRPAHRAQAGLGSRQRLPAEPQHRAVARQDGSRRTPDRCSGRPGARRPTSVARSADRRRPVRA